MNLWEWRAEIPFDSADAVDGALLESEAEAWSVHQDVILRRAWLVGIFPDESSGHEEWRRLSAVLPHVTPPSVRPLPDADWRDSYKAHFKRWQFGRLHWVPAWERETFSLPPGDEVLWLDPGLAFGTGNHETTRLCVERLIELAPTLGPGARVLDAGCGSGILALSAAKLGFREVTGFDNDPEAVRVAEENAALNHLAGRVTFFVGDLISGLSGRSADLLLANIQADVLTAFAGPLLRAIAPGGSLVLSGILAAERALVRQRFEEAGAGGGTVRDALLGEWCSLLWTRNR